VQIKSLMRVFQLFHGWRIVVAALVMMCVQAGTAAYSFGVLFKPIMYEFGWSRGTTSIAQSIFILMGGISGLLIARLIGHINIKTLVFLGAVIGGTSFLLLSRVTNIWHLYLLYFFVGIGLGGGAGFVPIAIIISNWFTRRRGMAMGIASAGIGLGAMVLAPLIGYAIQFFGWRMTYILMGLLVFAVDIPLALLVLRMKPQEMGLLPDGEEPLRTREAALVEESSRNHSMESTDKLEHGGIAIWTKSWPFWLLCLGFALAQIGEVSIVIHEVPFLTDMGIPAGIAAGALGLTGGIGGIGKVTFGWLADKLSLRYVTILCFTLQLLGVLILLRVHSVAMVWLFVVEFGFGMGGMTTLLPLAVGDLFGIASFATVYGFVQLLVIGVSTAGPSCAGFIYDATGSYSIVFTIFSILYIMAIIAVYFAWGINPGPVRSLRKRY
jgi:MFS family permease